MTGEYEAVDLVEPLTEREQEVLALLAQGKTNQELAAELVLSVNTVKWHNRQIYAKLNVNNREQAAERAHQLGLIVGEEERSAPDNNLPAAPGELVGRQTELAELDELVVAPNVRLVTITGVGGVGKTRLAYAAAARQLERRPYLFVDGIYVLSLSSLDEVAQLPATIANTVNASFQDVTHGDRSVDRQIADYLRKKKILLVLDNFEHLLQGATALGDLVQRTANLQLLITSRERLGLREEHVFPLGGFANNWGETDTALRNPFVQLFLQSARRVCPDFELKPEDFSALARLQKITGGLPLAVELAASWVEVLPVAEIAVRIREDVDFLQTDLRNVPERQRSIRALFEASRRRLEPALQVAFSRLSLFRGGFTRGAAQEVAGASVRALATLSAKSLLQYDPGRDRYQLHALLRQFGEQKLQEEPQLEQETRDRHAAFYCRFLRQWEQAWVGKEAGAALAAVTQERGNVRLAWKWAVAQGQMSLIAAGLDSLCAYYARHGYQDEARDLLQAASDALFSSLEKKDDEPRRRRLLARVLIWRAHFAPFIAEGRVALEQAEALLKEVRRQKIDGRQEDAFFALHKGRLENRVKPRLAQSYFEQALSLYRELEDTAGEARAMTGLGDAQWHLGNYGEAADLVRRGLARHEILGDRSSMARALASLGLIEKHRGQLAEAEQAHRESYALYQALGDRSGAAHVAGMLTNTLCWSGDFAGAHAVAREGLQLAEQVGSGRLTASLLAALGYASTHLGRYDEARQQMEQAAALAQAAGARQTLGWCLASVGELSLASSAYRTAVAQLEEAAGVLATFGKSTWTLPLITQALALRQSGHFAPACRVLAQALRENMNVRVSHVAANALPVAALFAAGEGDIPWALELYALAHCDPFVANSRWFEDVVGAEIESLAARLPAESVEAAHARGRTLDLWDTVAKILQELERAEV